MPERSASFGVAARGTAADGRCTGAAGEAVLAPGAASLGRPSKLAAGEKPSASAINPQLNRVSYVRITRLLSSTARMRNGAIARRPHLLGVFPKVARAKSLLAGLPTLGPRIELGRRKRDVERSLVGIEGDHVAVAQERDRPANRSLRPDMADAETAGRAGEAAIRNQRHLAAHALPVERSGGRQHLAHARAAFGALVSDHEHVAFPILLVLHGLEARLFAVKAARGPGELHVRHPGNFHDRASRRQVALEADDATGGGQRLVSGTDHILVLVPRHPLEVFTHGTPCHSDAIAVQEAVVEQRLHQQRDAAYFE